MREAIDMFGWTMILQLAALALAFFVVVLFPLWWPRWRAGRRRWPRPWLFSAVVGCLTYGLWYLLLLALGVPVGVYEVFLAPQLREAGILEYGTLEAAWQWISNYSWLAVLVLQVLMTVVLTRRLGRRWSGVCRGLVEPPGPAAA